jgi:cold shock CspA family protein
MTNSKTNDDEKIWTGVVSFWSDRGFGFITPDYGDLLDVYVHASQLPGRRGKRNLAKGQAVQFQMDVLDGQIFARNVQIVNARPTQSLVAEEAQR